MLSDKLLSELHELSRADKLRAMSYLVNELSQEEPELTLTPGAQVEIWSPYDAFGAAETLEKCSKTARKRMILDRPHSPYL